ncbi:MAG: hypothetical protein AB3K77_03435 [Methanosarcinaceae archaeon]
MMLKVRISLFLYHEKPLDIPISLLLFLFYRGRPFAFGERGLGMESGNGRLSGVLDFPDFQVAWAYAGTRGSKVNLKGGFGHAVCFDDAVCPGPEV